MSVWELAIEGLGDCTSSNSVGILSCRVSRDVACISGATLGTSCHVLVWAGKFPILTDPKEGL